MTLEEGITAAIECKKRVRDVYLDATKKAKHPTGKRVLRILSEDEQKQIDYLLDKLEEWEQAGKVTVDKSRTAIPSSENIDKCTQQLISNMPPWDEGCELNILRKAMDVDEETTKLLRKLADGLANEAREMFTRFLEIEEGYKKILQAEIDSIGRTGFWFDIQEFNLE